MDTSTPSYRGYRYPPEIISHAVWLYHRFGLSLRDVEDILAERGIAVSYETIRQWSRKFGTEYARKLKRRQGRLGDTWHLDELFVTIQGKRQYLWRAVDQDGDVLDILVQSRRNRRAAERFLPRCRHCRCPDHQPPRPCRLVYLMPILVPGVGAQGGDLAASVRGGVDANGRRVVIAVGRQVLYASKGAGYAQAARAEAQRLREAINAELDAMGVGWS